jgi:hypothetical protein
MAETTQAQRPPDADNRTAVGRLTLLVDVDDGTETVTYERRLPDAEAARRWCETKVEWAAASAAVLEIQVTEEVWGRRHAWEAVVSRHTPETLQLGVRSRTGGVTWGACHPVGTDPASRRA